MGWYYLILLQAYYYYHKCHLLFFVIIFKLVCCPVGWLIFIGYCCMFLIWIVGLDIIEGRRWGMGWVFFIGLGMSRLYFSGGAFLCFGLSMVCRLSEEGGTPCQKRARPDWWYAPGTAGCLNLGVAVSLDWDWFILIFYRLCLICPHGFVLWSVPARHLVALFFSHCPCWSYLFSP